MSPLEQQHIVMLERALEADFVPNLPPLLDQTKPINEQQRKNLSRAFSAFALHKLCEITPVDAARAVIDDFDDYGVDAIYYHAPSETVYLVQSKLKAAEQFSQDEALAFCQGVRKLISQDFTGFNENVQRRLVDIEDALDNCSSIQLVIAHTGSGVSNHAKNAVEELLSDESHGEERLKSKIIDYDCVSVVNDLRASKAYERVDSDLWVHKCTTVKEPRVTYFGLVKLTDLVSLHRKHDKALYAKNIRSFLGHKTDVNTSIQQTLGTRPADFVYLNNGVTALCQFIEPKSTKAAQGGRKRLKIKGFSVINGAQTIATSAQFLVDNPGSDISTANVSLTLIQANADGDFGKAVTRARNHQNPVLLSNFVALDDDQERLRRELAYLDIHYVYKAEGPDATNNPNRITVEDAAQALAICHADPRFVVWLKKEPARLLDTESAQYKALFNPSLTAFQLINAVRFNKYTQGRMLAETLGARGQERLTYKHGNYALSWVLSKRVKTLFSMLALAEEAKLRTVLSVPFDQLRQLHWNKAHAATVAVAGPPAIYGMGPLSFFRNQTYVIPFLEDILIEYYALTTDPVVGIKKGQQAAGQPYPTDLFNYLISKAPQIGGLV